MAVLRLPDSPSVPLLARCRSARIIATALFICTTCWCFWEALHLRFRRELPGDAPGRQVLVAQSDDPDATGILDAIPAVPTADRARAWAESAAPLILLGIILILWIWLRRISLAMGAMIPLLISLIWMFGVARALFGGISLHPGLGEAGTLLVIGVASAFLSATVLLPPLLRRLRRPRSPGRVRAILRLFGRAVLVSIVFLLAIPPFGEWLLSRQRPAGIQTIPNLPLVQTGPLSRRVGDSWMRRREGIWEISCGGTPEQIGYAVGKLGAPINVRIENEMFEQLDALLPNVWSRWIITRLVGANLLSLPQYISPALQQEVFATAKACDDPHSYIAPTYPRLLGYHALHDVSQLLVDNPLLTEQAGGCTGVIARPEFSGDGHLWLARNFDFEAGETFGRHKSVTYCRPKEGLAFASVSWPAVAGCVTGMNQQRIAVFLNAAATRDLRRIGTPTIMMLREVLQYARSVDEAVAIIRRTPVFVSDIIVVADGKTGEAVVVEKSPADTAVCSVGERAVVANHCVSPRFRDDPVNRRRMADGTTVQRFQRASELLSRLRGKVNQPALASLLRDKKGIGDKEIGLGNRNAIDALIACHSAIMDVTAGRLWVAAWPHAEGAFVYVDVMAMLGDDAANYTADRAMNDLADPMLTNGDWDRYRRSRLACARASAALVRGNALAATAEATEAIRENPSFYLGHELLGRALLTQGKKAAARESLNRALAVDPPYAAHRAAITELLR